MKRRADDPTFGGATSFVDVVRDRARRWPRREVFTFLTDGEGDREDLLTFGRLDLRARAVGARLRELGLAGERALLLYPPGLEFLEAFSGCLYGGVVAIPAHLPRVNRPMPRLRAVVADARPRALLTTNALLPDADRWAAAVPEMDGLQRLATDAVDDAPAECWSALELGPGSPAFLQYTSGSTTAPKGVIVTHGNLLHNSALIRQCFASTEESRGVFWLPLFHDMGLIGGVLQTVYCGGKSTLLSPVAFLQRPLRWLQAISRTGATISGGPDFAYDLCVRKISDEQKIGLDLGRWAVAFNGAEPVRPETLDRFAEAFAPCGFRRQAFLPCYGLAEATLMVSGVRPPSGPTVVALRADALGQSRVEPAGSDETKLKRLAGCGGVPDGLEVAIVDPATDTLCPADRVGEIWVAGPGVARGYWDRPEESERTFRATLPGRDGVTFLRTGDLGFLRDGSLFVAGRLKDVVIVRGRNVYPQDVEWAVERCHPALRPGGGAAFAVEVDGEERLVVAHEVERPGKGDEAAEEVVEAVRRAVADEFEIDVYAVRLIRPLSLPKTSSGKVQRHTCREAFLADTLEVVGSWTRAVPERTQVEAAAETPAPNEPGRSRTAREIEEWLAARVGVPLGVEASAVDVRRPFASFGLGSLQAVTLASELEQWLGRPLAPTLAYDHPTIEALARHLAGEATAPSLLREEGGPGPAGEPIAVIGIGCRFPGASGPEAFWRLLAGGVDAVGEAPEGRRGFEGRGGFLDRVDGFDADFFGVSPREAVLTDPQHRMLLEVAWEALEDAGQAPGALAGKAVGVFVGVSTNDYGRLVAARPDVQDVYTLTGNAASVAANRVSFAFDFRGPSLAVDTACSSSLVAMELACRSLRSGESELALAGGVNLLLDPEVTGQFARAGFLAPDGRCKAFDARADGYVRGEGAGLVALKPLARALADGDPVYALIRGGAVGQDGRSNGLTAPSRPAQEAVLRAAYRSAGLAPGRVDYVEAHGTGTPLGDPIEAGALGAVLAEGRPADRPCAVGSVKSNVGHLEAAAGVAGLIKVALMLRHRAVPPSLHFEAPNPQIPFDRLPLRVARELTPWPAGPGPVVAGVSSFGFGGTNAHLVLESAPDRPETPPERPAGDVILPISARSPEALKALARSYRDELSTWDAGPGLHDLAYSAAVRRDHHDHRLALVAGTAGEAVVHLDAYFRGEPCAGLVSGRRPAHGRGPRLAFVFSGQGGYWRGAGRGLAGREPVVRDVLSACDRWLTRHAGWSLLEWLSADGPAPTEFAQPAQFAVQAALAALWRSWGVVPDAVVGHSLGEVAAAHAAGILSLDDGLRLVVERGRLMRRVEGQGKTAAVGLPADEARRRIADLGLADRVFIAARNGPASTTLSGEPAAVGQIVRTLQEEGIFARALDVDCAFHSPVMDSLRRELEDALDGLRPGPAAVPFVSTVTGRPLDGRDLGADYWGRNLREPVRFEDAVGTLIDDPYDLFLEVGPHPVLSAAVAECLQSREVSGVVLPSLRKGDNGRETLLRSLGALYARGCAVRWERLYPSGRFVRLPSYPWQHRRFWLDDSPSDGTTHRNGVATSGSANGVGHNGSVSGNGSNGAHHRPHPVPSSDLGELFYQVHWRPGDGPALTSGAAADARSGWKGRWLILADSGGVGRALRARLEALGAECVMVPSTGEAGATRVEFLQALEAGPWRGVVHLWSLDVAPADRATPPDLDAAERLGCGSVLRAAQALAGLAGPTPPRLWVATRGAQPAGEGAGRLAVLQAPVWGMGRSLALEHPECWGGLIDLDPDAADEDHAEALVDLIGRADAEDQVAWRGGRRLVARLERGPVAVETRPLTVRPEGTYLVTGGLGALGLRAARWLVDRGARRLVLLGRRGLPVRGIWSRLAPDEPARAAVEAIAEMERLGATVVVASADVGDADRMADLFEHWSETLPPLRGVIHAAGVADPRPARELTGEALRATLRPKVAGTLVLDRLTRVLDLDFFALFSSVSSVWGSQRLSDYAAGNQFLDAVAHDRRALGLPATSVNWGPWAGSGMAAAGWGRALELMGLRPIEPGRAFDALGHLLGSGPAQVAAADVDWSTFKALYRTEDRRQFLQRIDDRPRPKADIRQIKGALDDPLRLRRLPADRRLGKVLDYLRGRVAGVLRLEPGGVDPERPLNTLGLDSLVAMELKAQVEADLGDVLPLTSLLESPTVGHLAERVLARLVRGSNGEADGIATATAVLDFPSGRSPSGLNGLSEEPDPETETEPGPGAGTRRDAPAVVPVARVGPLPLSFPQQALWFLEQLAPERPTFNVTAAARVTGPLDREALGRALKEVVRRHEALRTTFAVEDGRPVQVIMPGMDVDWETADLSGLPDDRRADALEEIATEAARRPFDLTAGPLIRASIVRLGRHEHAALLTTHHIVTDGSSLGITADELTALYQAFRRRQPSPLPEPAVQMADFAAWQRSWLRGEALDDLLAYWRGRLAAVPPLDLPADRPRPPARTTGGAQRAFALSPALSGSIRELGHRESATPFMTLLAAFKALLGRYSGQDDFAVGTAVANRGRPETRGLIGYFVNMLGLRADLSGDPTFVELLARVRAEALGAYEHQELPLEALLEDLRLPRDPSRTPLFQVIFVLTKNQVGEASRGGLTLRPLHVGAGTGTAKFDLSLYMEETPEGFVGALEYSTDLFDEATVDRMLGHFRTLLEGVVADPDRRISELPLLSETERRRVLGDWAGSEPAAGVETCVHHLFEAQAARTPEGVAVVHDGRRVSYRELNEQANQVAHHLRALGVGPEVRVGVCLDRSPELVAGLLGVLKAGGAYVPVDPDDPAGRLAFLLRDARVAVLLTVRGLVPKLAEAGAAAVVCLDADAPAIAARPTENPEPRATPANLAYVVYTSGSTGAPKGVMVSHASLALAYFAWERAYGLRDGVTRHLQAAGVAFDVFTGDWVRALGSGGTLVVCPRETLLDPPALHALMTRERVDFVELVPAVAENLMRHLEESGGSLDGVKLIAVGSDQWHAGQHERLRRLAGPSARVVNSYGLTEATIDSTFFEGALDGQPPGRPVPIGRPLAGTRVFVLDRAMRPVPAGVPGELFVGGVVVARGYLGRPGLTAGRFVPDPYGPAPGARLYRTGDLARWRPDGTLELVGRADHQVKVRGVRVEPGEVESALLQHESVRSAAVVARDDAAGAKRLAAYVVPADPQAPPDPQALRRWLKDRLPDPMVPPSLVVLDALPLTPNGKVDRRALAALEPPPAPRDPAADTAAPRTPVEEQLVRLTSDVLGGASVGVHDNVFELGVDSIRVIQIVALARKGGLRLEPGQFFRHQTVAELAAVVAVEPEPGSGLVTTHSQAPGSLLSGADWRSLVESAAGRVEDAYPLSPVQEGMLFHTVHAPRPGVYVEQFTCRLRGGLDVPAFERAWRRLIARHPALRTAVHRVESDRPVQVVYESADLPLSVEDWRDVAPSEQTGRLEEFLRTDRARGFVLSWAPLFRLTLIRLGDADRLVWTYHHLALDGWCVPVLLKELLDLYDAARGGPEPALPPVRPFRDFLAWLRDQDGSEAEAFWKDELAGFRAPTPLGIGRARDDRPDETGGHGESEVRLSAGTTEALRAVARANRLTLNTVVQGAWALLLGRYSGQGEVVFGVTVSGRPSGLAGAESMVGLFINTLPLRVAVPESARLVPWLRDLQARQAEMRRFESSPLVRVHGWSDVPRGRPLFESIFVFENFPVDAALPTRAGSLGVEDVRFIEQTSYPLTVTAVPGDALLLRIGYDTGRFDAGSVGRMLGHLRTLLEGIADDPDRPLADLPMLTESERQQLLRQWNDPARPGPSAPELDGLPDEDLDDWIERLGCST
jgi:amino acid adenylation domain-containing protein